jgi:adenosylcobinamide-GDP ribazoletransferase
VKNQFKIFLTAIMFYTRIPINHIEGYSPDMLNKSTRFFPVIGFLTGGFGALVFWSVSLILPVPLAILLSIVGTILFTGAFHEDGFADFCDGFGGGYTQERILEIMKDSRVGTYGSLGILLMLLLKFYALSEFQVTQIPLVLVVAHTFSRMFPVLMIYIAKYARLDATSKTKPIGKADSVGSLLFAMAVGIAPLFFIPWQWAVASALVLLALLFLFWRYITRKLGGYTGDVLGALQQLGEVFFYLTVLAVQNLML